MQQNKRHLMYGTRDVMNGKVMQEESCYRQAKQDFGEEFNGHEGKVVIPMNKAKRFRKMISGKSRCRNTLWLWPGPR